MKRMIGALVVLAISVGVAAGQTLPAGHPPMGKPAGATTMPAGHPPMGMMGGAKPGELPAGHPPMGAMKGTGKMPAGHPSMEEMMAAGSGTQKAPQLKGKLTVKVVPGTQGGKVVADEPVSVELLHRGMLVRPPNELKTDAQGMVVLEEVPVSPPVQARVTVKHAGLSQQMVTPLLSPTEPELDLEVKVYETTETAPAWTVGMAHVLVQRMEDGKAVRVTQVYMSVAEGDRAWLGEKVGEERVTMSIALPEGAESVALKGFDVAATKLANGKIVTGGALFPGRSIYELSYTMKAEKRAVTLPISAPATVGMMMVAVPVEGMQAKATGLNEMGVREMEGGEKTRMFGTKDLPAGQTVTLALTGIRAVNEPQESSSKFTPKNIALGGAFLMVLIAAGVMMMRKPKLPQEAKK